MSQTVLQSRMTEMLYSQIKMMLVYSVEFI